MIDSSSLDRPSFDLTSDRPIEIIRVRHDNIDNYLFDMHYELELGVVISGKMKREYMDLTAELGPGDVWFCGMWEPHGFELMETPCEVVVYVVDPAYLSKRDVLNRNVLSPFQVNPKQRPTTPAAGRHNLIRHSREVFDQADLGNDPDWAKLHFFQSVLRVVQDWLPPESQDNYFDQHQSIQPSLQLVFNERRLISTEEAANTCHMSLSKFRNTFKKLMNSPFSEFALQYRVKGALSELKNSDKTQEAVAYDWGFTDASHLIKHVQKLSKWA